MADITSHSEIRKKLHEYSKYVLGIAWFALVNDMKILSGLDVVGFYQSALG